MLYLSSVHYFGQHSLKTEKLFSRNKSGGILNGFIDSIFIDSIESNQQLKFHTNNAQLGRLHNEMPGIVDYQVTFPPLACSVNCELNANYSYM